MNPRSTIQVLALARNLLLLACAVSFRIEAQPPSPITLSEFIYTNAPVPSCHASTLAETPDGSIVASWFGGTAEGKPDVAIWSARKTNGKWSAPTKVADGTQPDQTLLPCWNPVLFQAPGGPLVLFYKVGPKPHNWWGMRTVSQDGGLTWNIPTRLPENILGPIKNKPVLLQNKQLLCPTSTENAGWRVNMEQTPDTGITWSSSPALNDPNEFGAIQPTILTHGGTRLQILCRTRQGVISESWSEDLGNTWSHMKATTLPNPNSGIDAVSLSDGRHVLIYNHTARGRSPLNLAISQDGQKWMAAATLESKPGEFSYPAIIQTRDGLLHLTYTWNRERIRHVVVNPSRLKPVAILNGTWPATAP